MDNNEPMNFVITTADGTGTYKGTGSVQSVTWTDPTYLSGGNTNPTYLPATSHEWSLRLNEVAIPKELLVCQICGEEDVIVFCEACKEVLKLARKVWAEQILKEIEDDLS